jgi:Skp family chaperone for outer membrane proteins
MNRLIKTLMVTAALGVSVASTGALAQTATEPATPPAPVAPVPSPVVVFTLQGVMGATAAGRDMGTKLQNIRATMVAELEAEGRALTAERERFLQTPASQLQAPETRRAEAALQQRFEAFEIMGRRTEIDLQATTERAQNQFLQALQPVLQGVMERRGAVIVLERSQVTIAVPGVDISRELVTALDAAVTTIDVARVRVQTEEEAAAAAAAPGAAAHQCLYQHRAQRLCRVARHRCQCRAKRTPEPTPAHLMRWQEGHR